MKRLVVLIVVLCTASAAWGAGVVFQTTASASYAVSYGNWRSLAYQLPGAFRFIDRLSLTVEQQKALDKIQRDWGTQQQESYAAAAKEHPPLSAEDQKNPEKVKTYYAARAELMKAAQIPPPVDLVDDVLSDEQRGKILEAGRVTETWTAWLSEHMAKYDKKLDEALGPEPPNQPPARRYLYQMYEGLVDNGLLLSRVGLSEEQNASLEEMRKQYYAEYNTLLTPLNQALRGTSAMPYPQINAVSRAVSNQSRTEIQKKYRDLAAKVLTEPQQKALAKAAAIVDERDKAIWERYTQYVAELSAIFPSPAAAQPAGTTVQPSPPGDKKDAKPK